MEINKLLVLTQSGENMPLIDAVNKKAGVLKFQDMYNIFMAISPEDITVLDKLGNTYEAKKGDLIVKSNCREVYGVLSANTSVVDLLGYIALQKEETKKRREAEDKAYTLKHGNIEKINEAVPIVSDVCCGSEN